MTKLLILSDSHGGSDAIARILKAERENIDALIFLGDGLRDLELALTKYPRLRTYADGRKLCFGALEPYDGWPLSIRSSFSIRTGTCTV